LTGGQTVAQKILAAHAGKRHVEIGEVIFPEFDFYIVQETPFPEFWAEVENMGMSRLARPEKTIVIADHEVPTMSMQGRLRWSKTMELANKLGVKHLIKPGTGIQHLVLPEKGFILPGNLTCSFDGHALNFGALGCYPMTAVYEFPTVMATGTIWMVVPETILVTLEGKLPFGCSARDLALYISAQIGPQMADSKVIQFAGPGVGNLSVNERMILCGVMAEIGAESSIIEPDELVLDYVSKVAVSSYAPVYGDQDAQFAARYEVNMDELEPMIALPPSPDNVKPVSEVANRRIDSAYIGSCQSGTIEELRIAAQILKGRKVHPDVDLLVVPSTRQVFRQAASEGLLEIFIEANAIILGPTCLPCFGNIFHMDRGEVRVSTGTRNDPGRMGSLESEIYLAGAAVAAASAVCGKICDPRGLLNR